MHGCVFLLQLNQETHMTLRMLDAQTFDFEATTSSEFTKTVVGMA